MKRQISVYWLFCLIFALSMSVCAYAQGSEKTNVEQNKQLHSYESKRFGIRLSYDDSWYILSEQETKQLYGAAIETLSWSDQNLKEHLEKKENVYELFAVKVDDLANLNIGIDFFNKEYSGLYDAIKEGLDTPDLREYSQLLKQQLESIGLSSVSVGHEVIDFAGDQYPSWITEYNVNGANYRIRQIWIHPEEGEYIGTVCISAGSLAQENEMMDMFSEIEG